MVGHLRDYFFAAAIQLLEPEEKNNNHKICKLQKLLQVVSHYIPPPLPSPKDKSNAPTTNTKADPPFFSFPPVPSFPNKLSS